MIQLLVGVHLVIPVVLYLFHLLTGKRPITNSVAVEADYAVIVTAYEQTSMLSSVVDSLLAMNYENYLIYIVADNCDITGLHFNSNKVVLLKPETVLAGNTRSHFYAIHRFKRAHERLTIIDSDNLVHPDYLKELNVYFDKGFQAVQGVRQAKNLNTTLACLDAARDIYYHFYDGKILFELGSSATLAGSGMAFTTVLYRQCLEHRDINGAGFDKVLQAAIVQKDLRIAFVENAIVYDEKTAGANQLVSQRARWINTWFKYFTLGFRLMASGIRNASRNQFLFGVILVRPPLFIFLILSVLFMGINLLLHSWFAAAWLAGLLLFVTGFIIPLLKPGIDVRVYRSLVKIPKFMFLQVLSLLSARNANKKSVASKHTYSSKIDDVLANK
ncbi:hypothetical protein FLA_6286 [Filimonas lacunae]|nr:hypothetical protein FLA_6286 [Filimonas lacunae]